MQLMNEVLKFPFSESLEIIKEVPAQFPWFMEASTKVCATGSNTGLYFDKKNLKLVCKNC